MTAAPPIVPGMPWRNSKPVSDASHAVCATCLSDAPACATMRPSAASTSTSESPSPMWMTSASSPSSATSKLLPRPNTCQATCASFAQASAAATSATHPASRKSAAGPPTPKLVCALMGSPNRRVLCSSAASSSQANPSHDPALTRATLPRRRPSCRPRCWPCAATCGR